MSERDDRRKFATDEERRRWRRAADELGLPKIPTREQVKRAVWEREDAERKADR